ncbi:MAG: alpha/beta hydrolase [Flavobacteriales bacterium]|nr:alpha/beta hydrolase [Bacteroidota bacterium]MCB9241393.1 alpha/beta hydrolase [Flavobacteriales bacterium]
MSKTIILLHGALGSPIQFHAIQSELAHFDTHAIGFTGHMGGEPPKLSFDVFDRDIMNYLDSQQIETCSVFGFSMGGYAAMHLALSHPDRFEKIATLGTKFSWSLEESRKEAVKLHPQIVMEKVPQYADYLRSLHGMNWSDLMYRTAEMMLDLGTGKALTMDDLGTINIPVTIGRGEKDRMISLDESIEASSALPQAKYVELPDLVHPLERLDPKVVAQYIQRELG